MKVMTVKGIEKAIRAIKAKNGDNEVQHGDEDNLYFSVLQAIAGGEIEGDLAKECARAVLKTKYLDFHRWYA